MPKKSSPAKTAKKKSAGKKSAKKTSPKKKPAKQASAKKPIAKKAVAKKAVAKKAVAKKLSAAPKKSSAAKKASAKAPTAKASAKPARTPVARAQWTAFFSPLDDRVLVIRDGASDRTPGGLFIPDTASDAQRPARGIVVAVGRGHLDKKGRLRPLDVRVDDCVLFETHAGSEIEMRGEKVLVLREKDVLGVTK